MSYSFVCLVVFLLAYLVNITYVSVFYHRGITHQAIRLRPWLRKFVVATGTWMTGLDPLPWCCMHRMHHLYSDLPQDPHSPVNHGVLRVLVAQKYAYEAIQQGLIDGDKKYTSIVSDLDFSVNWLTRRGLFLVPYVLQGLVAVAIGFIFGTWLLGICYFLGMMSHPLQGWMVNAYGHHSGYRNFETPDHSQNNIWVALFVLGEGYQNNHHQNQNAANFGAKWWEVDFGFWICKLARLLRLVDFPSDVRIASGGVVIPKLKLTES